MEGRGREGGREGGKGLQTSQRMKRSLLMKGGGWLVLSSTLCFFRSHPSLPLSFPLSLLIFFP